MISPEAILLFIDRQKRLLRRTYDEGWRLGMESYEPDEDPASVPTLPRDMAIIGLSGAALLAALRRYPYLAPGHPDPVRRALSLAPSFIGLNRMAGELSLLVSGASPQSVADWASTNSFRLAAGDSVAWAGEQAGFAEAANADGQLLYAWSSAGDNRVCPDCELLSSFPPMALTDWPTSPGAGDTTCNVGCRCSWDTWAADLPPDYLPQLSADQQALADDLANQQAQTLADMMSEVAYLEG